MELKVKREYSRADKKQQQHQEKNTNSHRIQSFISFGFGNFCIINTHRCVNGAAYSSLDHYYSLKCIRYTN